MAVTLTQQGHKILDRRDNKVRSILRAKAPVWLVFEQVYPQEEAVIFNVVFQDRNYGWLNRRYRYDAFNDVLYHMGERRISEAEMLDVQQQPVYLAGS